MQLVHVFVSAKWERALWYASGRIVSIYTSSPRSTCHHNIFITKFQAFLKRFLVILRSLPLSLKLTGK